MEQLTTLLNPVTPKSAKVNIEVKFKFFLQNIEKQMEPSKCTAKEVSFEWSHHRISSKDSQVRTPLQVYIIDSE